MPISNTYLIDNIEGMKKFPAGFFDIAIIDPPYGIGQNWRKDKRTQFYNHRNDFNNSIPDSEYFSELFRVSKHQIIWGCNYYWNYLPPSNNLIFWDKGKDAEKMHGSAGELAWTSITKFPLIKVFLPWNGAVKCENVRRIHPHQKPVKLYEWTISKFCKPGWHILDTHMGSGSCRIAAANLGFDFTGFENDPNYFTDQERRYEQHRIPLRMDI